MEIKFKDVIHLYLGCEMFCTDGETYKLKPSNMPNNWDTLKENFTNSKPILRNLNSMTFDEAKILFDLPENAEFIKSRPYLDGLEFEYRWVSEKINNADGYSYSGIAFTSAFSLKQSKFYYLLKQRFDLFDLIKNKEAVDMNDLKVVK